MKTSFCRSRVFFVSLLAIVLSGAAVRAEEFAPPTAERQPAPAAAKEAAPSAPAAASQPVATPAEIAAWIADLEDSRYLTREQSTRKLLSAGIPALEPLLEAANGEGPERVDRAVWILRRQGVAKDASLRRQALERLVRLKDRPQLVAAAAQALTVLRHHDAVAAIEKLGGRFTSAQLAPGQGSTEPYLTEFVVLDSQWRGGDAGLAHLSDLLGLQQVAIVGTDISLTGLAQLQKVRQLSRVLLYGTNLEQADVSKLQALFPHVTVDYRRGGLLGVGANSINGMGPAVVDRVTEGGVAEAAGIKVGDVIQQFNGQPVGSFTELTSKIGELKAGDEVKLDISREGKPMSFTLKLGQWETI